MKQQCAVPKLEGWMTTVEAAALLGTDKANVYRLIFEERALATVRCVGEKPLYLLSSSEVRALARDRAALGERVKARSLDRTALAERNRRIKEWGRANGFDVQSAGRPSLRLVQAYDTAHPNE